MAADKFTTPLPFQHSPSDGIRRHRPVLPVQTHRRIKDGKMKCSRCKEYKQLTAFAIKATGLFNPYCRKCCQAVSNEWAKRHPEKRKAVMKRYRASGKHRNSELKYQYGITEAEYNRMAAEQNSQCAICEVVVSGHLCIDHNHATKQVRGLLCMHCNSILGLAKESPARLLSAIAYLKVWEARA